MKRRTKQVVAALAAGAAAVSIIPIQAAIAESSPASDFITFEIQERASIELRGVLGYVDIDYTCRDGSIPEFWVDARQRVTDGRIAQASGYMGDLTCDGTERTVEVELQPYEFAFDQGQVLVTASTELCDPDTCAFYEDRAVVLMKIRNR